MRAAVVRIAPVVLGLVAAAGLIMLLRTQWMPVAVAGGSMEPALTPGDVVLVRTGAPLRTGEVVLFRDRGSLVLHRLKRTTTSGWITRGDANPVDDARPLSRSRVVGVAVARVPFGKAAAVTRSWCVRYTTGSTAYARQ